MKRRFEFKADRPYSGLLSKLHLTAKQRMGLLKWALYGLLLLVLSLLQDVVLCRFRLFGATTELVPCGIFLICLLEGAQSGCVFALIASMLYVFSGSAAGLYSIVLITALAIGSTVFRQAYLRQGLPAAVLCGGSAMLLLQLLQFFWGLFLGLTVWPRIWGFFITALLSTALMPLIYPAVLAIASIGGEVWKE